MFSTGPQAELLYLNLGSNRPCCTDMNRIIDLWQSATGDRVKDRPPGTQAQPLRLPIPRAPSLRAVLVTDRHGLRDSDSGRAERPGVAASCARRSSPSGSVRRPGCRTTR